MGTRQDVTDIYLDSIVGADAVLPAAGDDGMSIAVSGGSPGSVQLAYWPEVEAIVAAMT